MIITQIPHKSRFQVLNLNFKSVFSGDTAGRYIFADNKELFSTIPNTVFLIEKISVSGDISEDLFLRSIIKSPEIRFKQKITGEIIHNQGIPVNKFFDGLDIGVWFKNDTEGEGITLDISGELKQISETVGKNEINLAVSVLIWAIDEREYNKAFRNTTLPNFGDNLRRG